MSLPVIGVRSYIDPRIDHGAAGDAKNVTDATIAAGSLSDVTSGTANWKASDVGKVIGIRKAGVIDATKTIPKTHVTTIASYVSPTHVTLTAPAVNAVAGEFAAWGSDDTIPLRNAVAASSANRKPIRLGVGRYLTTATINWLNYAALIGEGRYLSALQPVGTAFAPVQYLGSDNVFVTAWVMKNLEIDGNGLCDSSYTTGTKGIVGQHLKECLFENLWVHHTPATAIGCDYWVNGAIINCWGDFGGRQVDELGGAGGGSGIGIGTGKYDYECLEVTGGGATSTGGTGSGYYGLFLEAQTTPNPLARGYRIQGFVARGYKYGLSENGVQGAIFDACQAYQNTIGGFRISKALTNRYGRDTQFSDCIAMANAIGLELGSHDGQVKWDGGQIGFNTSDGIQMVDPNVGGTVPTNIRIRDADIFHNTGNAVRLLSGNWGRVSLEGGHYFNNLGAAIRVARPVSLLRVTRISAFDDQATKTQTYGLDTTGASVVTELVYGGNDFRGNATANDLLPAGTVTTNTSVLGGNL